MFDAADRRPLLEEALMALCLIVEFEQTVHVRLIEQVTAIQFSRQSCVRVSVAGIPLPSQCS